MTDKIVVFTTCGSEEEARKLAAVLIEKHLAACVNITAPVTSVYRWKGAVEESKEWMLIIKSRRERFEQLRVAARIRALLRTAGGAGDSGGRGLAQLSRLGGGRDAVDRA